MNAPHGYPLLRDDAEHRRLAMQAAFWSPEAAALFESAGVAAGQRVADLGCGTLHVAALLARHVGPGGDVTAMDSDDALVAEMAASIHAGGTRPIRVECGDGYATGWPAGHRDAAHARFLAAPAGRLPRLVAEMARIVRPGSLLMLQEPDAETWHIPGAGEAWLQLREWIRAGFRARGGDFDCGRQLAAALHGAGVGDIEERHVTRRLPGTHPYAALPLAFSRQLAPTWRAAGLAKPAESRAVLDAVARALAGSEQVTTFTLVQAWGRTPPGTPT